VAVVFNLATNKCPAVMTNIPYARHTHQKEWRFNGHCSLCPPYRPLLLAIIVTKSNKLSEERENSERTHCGTKCSMMHGVYQTNDGPSKAPSGRRFQTKLLGQRQKNARRPNFVLENDTVNNLVYIPTEFLQFSPSPLHPTITVPIPISPLPRDGNGNNMT